MTPNSVSSEPAAGHTEPFHKDVEFFFEKNFDGEGKLYYERRRGQFGADAKIEKVRIVTPQTLLKAFASMFLHRPHDVTKYYTLLEPEVGKSVFNPNDNLHIYYLAAYAAFRLESLFRNKRLNSEYKPCRHHLLMGFRDATIEAKVDTTGKAVEKKLQCALKFLADQNRSAEVFSDLIAIVDKLMVETKAGSFQQLAKSVALRDGLRARAPNLGFLPA